jgi:hypothetical protein
LAHFLLAGRGSFREHRARGGGHATSQQGNRDGDAIEIRGIGVFHFANGKIREAWFLDEDPHTADPWYDKAL